MRPARALFWVVLDADALQRAQRLPDVLDFLFAGLLLAHGLANVVAHLCEAVDGFAESSFDGFDLHQSSFQRGLGFLFGCCCLDVGGAGAVGCSVGVLCVGGLHGWWGGLVLIRWWRRSVGRSHGGHVIDNHAQRHEDHLTASLAEPEGRDRVNDLNAGEAKAQGFEQHALVAKDRHLRAGGASLRDVDLRPWHVGFRFAEEGEPTNFAPAAGPVGAADAEYAADRHGVELLLRTGRDGKLIMANTLEWLMQTAGSRGGGFFATHPGTEDRIQKVRSM